MRRRVIDQGETMTTAQKMGDIRMRLQTILDSLNMHFIGDPGPNRVILLAYLARVNYLLVGEKGTAKTARIKAFASHITEGKFFTKTLGKFTSPEKVFGLLDPKAFKQGDYVTKTAGMLPDADHAFLDEMLKPSGGMVNELLDILGPEREFQGTDTHLHVCGGATNWPEVNQRTEMTAPLYDRLLLRCEVRSATDLPEKATDKAAAALQLMKVGRALRKTSYASDVKVTMSEIREAHRASQDVEISDDMAKTVASLCLSLKYKKDKNGKQVRDISISDRRIVEVQAVLQANAWLEGRDFVSIQDVEVLLWCLWDVRADIERIAGALERLSTKAVKEIIAVVEVARKELRDIAQKGYTPARVKRVVSVVKSQALKADNMVDGPMITPQGREDAKREMRAMRVEYETFVKKISSMTGGQ